MPDDEREKIDYAMFLNEYLNDAKEGFQSINNALLELEKDNSLTEPLDEIFRAVHTLKSSSAMLRFSDIVELSQLTEGFLDRLRSRELIVTKESINVLFEIIDTFEKMVMDHAEGKEREGMTRAIYDINNLKQVVAHLESQEILALQGVIVINEDGTIESFNHAAGRIFGYAADEVIGSNVNVLMPEPHKSNHDHYVRNYAETDKAKVIGIGREVTGMRKDGSTFPMELTVNELKLTDRRLFIGIIRDVSRRKIKTDVTTTIEKIHTIRVRTDLLDSLFNQVGELIITKNRIDKLVSDIEGKELKAVLAVMERTINALQENVSAARMVPVDEIFRKFPRLVRDLARNAGKEVEFIIEGGEIELDKAMLDSISEPVIHLLRNAIDHGIEQHKRGRIRLAAKRAENHIMIEVEDNGRGIDIEDMKSVAVHKEFIAAEESVSMSDKDVLNLLFKPGFSTAEKVTDVSGRGVGLNVVKTVAEKLGGTVDLQTRKGNGSVFSLKLPLTTAIMQTLLVGVGEHIFAIPSDIIIETLEVKSEDIKEIKDTKALIIRNEVIPFIELGEVLNIHHSGKYRDAGYIMQEARHKMQGEEMGKEETPIAVIISRGGRSLGVGVDSLVDQMENIIKPFDPIAQQFKGFSGGTILGDGSVALLLDIPALFNFMTI